MAKWITIIGVVVAGTQVWPGTTIDDSINGTLLSNYNSAGGQAGEAEDPVLATAATTAVGMRAKGRSVQEVEAVMLSAYAASGGQPSSNYGDGSDGPLVFDGTTTILGIAPVANVYTMTKDIQATNVTVNAGVKIVTPFRFVGTGTLLNNAAINNDGHAGALGVAGAATTAGSYGSQGKAGGAGGVNAAGSAGTNAAASPNGPGAGGGGDGTNGGPGGDGSAHAGGAGGTAAASAATVGSVKNLQAVMNGASLGASPTAFAGGGGGGGGAGVDASAVGGGGGSGGGCLYVAFPRIINNGTISANGGAGAAGSGSTASGGGSGGGGGYVGILSAKPPTGTGTITASGGAAGAGTHGAVAGQVGFVGTVEKMVAA